MEAHVIAQNAIRDYENVTSEEEMDSFYD